MFKNKKLNSYILKSGLGVFCCILFFLLWAVLFHMTANAATPLDSDRASVTNLSVTNITDGITPFDPDNSSGNDADDHNKIIRSFDTITYTFKASMASDNSSDTFSEARAKLEFVLPLSQEEVTFDTAAMEHNDWATRSKTEPPRGCNGNRCTKIQSWSQTGFASQYFSAERKRLQRRKYNGRLSFRQYWYWQT